MDQTIGPSRPVSRRNRAQRRADRFRRHVQLPQTAPAKGRYRHIYAALDLGTNNCRLLIARAEEGGFSILDSFSRSVRLGEGLGQSGNLSDAAMSRAVEAVKICAQKMKRLGVTRGRAIATAACRAAGNGLAFIDRLKGETGIAFEIVTPPEEARLAVMGCSGLIERSYPGALVFDIGGGSTELIWLRMAKDSAERLPAIEAIASLPLGVVTLAERFGGHRLSPEIFPDMLAAAREALAAVEAPKLDGLAPGDLHMLGTSGTVTTIAGIHMGLPRYERRRVDGAWIETGDAVAIARRITALAHRERIVMPCIGQDRADLVMPGCAIFLALAEAWPVPRLRVADRGLREGILLALMEQADKERRRRKRRRRR